MYEVGGRAEPIPVGAHDVPRVHCQGQGVAVHAHCAHGVRGQDHAAPAPARETFVGPRICSPMAATTSSAPPSSGKRTAVQTRGSELAGQEAVHLRDGVVAEQGGGDARGRRRVLVGGRPVRHQRRGDLVGREHVLVRARPVGQQRAPRWLPASACPARSPCGSRPTGRPLAPRCSRPAAQPRWRWSLRRPAPSPFGSQQRVHLRRGVVGQQRSREGRVRRCDGRSSSRP